MRSWQKSTNALFAAMTTGVVGHRVSSRSNVMTSTLDGPVALLPETVREHREECRVTMRRDDDARAALTGALSVAAMGARLGVSWSPSEKRHCQASYRSDMHYFPRMGLVSDGLM